MSQTTAARTSTRKTLRPAAVGLVVATAAIIATLGFPSASPSASSFSEVRSPGGQRDLPRSAISATPAFSEVHRGDDSGARTEDDSGVSKDDGVLPDRVTVFDGEYPGIANLEPDLLRALREAATDAADEGIVFYVNSGWRSPEYQAQLFREAVSKYGSAQEAARWVATVDRSSHVSGDAVDIGPFDATAWLSEHGAHYGLCQIYRNESWHFEHRSEAASRGCPPMYVDSTRDPRMRQ